MVGVLFFQLTVPPQGYSYDAGCTWWSPMIPWYSKVLFCPIHLSIWIFPVELRKKQLKTKWEVCHLIRYCRSLPVTLDLLGWLGFCYRWGSFDCTGHSIAFISIQTLKPSENFLHNWILLLNVLNDTGFKIIIFLLSSSISFETLLSHQLMSIF